MKPLTLPFAFLSVLFAGAIFGFFYAWICSTMWGLDAIDPRVAITAMNGMNDSVRNATFAPAFFGTPIVLGLTAALAWSGGQARAAVFFGAGAVLYLVGAFALTASVNVPMNRALLEITAPEDIEEARKIWTEYSSRWQVYNTIRTLVSGVVLMLSAGGLWTLAKA